MKKITAFLLITITIFLFGCQSSSTQKTLEAVNYHTGTKGLELNFVTGSPPDKIYQTSSLDVQVEYSNKGAYPVSGGKMYLTGFDTQYLSLRPSSGTSPENIVAEEKSIFNPNGDLKQIATFTDTSVTMPADADILPQTIKATVCYDYRTQASFDVCINPHTTNALREDICQVQTVSSSGGQGAPIAVTKVEEEVYQNKLQFRIYFHNSGGGTAFRPEVIGNCHTSLSKDDANKVEIRSVTFSGRSMRCEPQNPIRLDESGNGFVFCYYEGDLGQDAYKTNLKIDIEYGYRTSIQKDIKILKSPIP